MLRRVRPSTWRLGVLFAETTTTFRARTSSRGSEKHAHAVEEPGRKPSYPLSSRRCHLLYTSQPQCTSDYVSSKIASDVLAAFRGRGRLAPDVAAVVRALSARGTTTGEPPEAKNVKDTYRETYPVLLSRYSRVEQMEDLPQIRAPNHPATRVRSSMPS